MRPIFVLIICHWSVALFSQASIKGPWTFEVGATTATFFRTPASINVRYTSPRFKWSTYELTEEEEEKHADDFRNTRLMVELIYSPPFKVFCTAFNVQSRLIHYKRFTTYLSGGMKIFIVPGPDFVRIPYLKAGHELWYLNIGLLLKFDLGKLAPYVDFGGDGTVTVGTEVKIHPVFKKPKKRYRLKKKPYNIE